MKSRNRVVAQRRVYLGILLRDIEKLYNAQGRKAEMPIHFVRELQKCHGSTKLYTYVKKCLQTMRDEAVTSYWESLGRDTLQWEIWPFTFSSMR